MNEEEIYNEIVHWENVNGEDFIEHFGSRIRENVFMAWCLGRRYIPSFKFDKWMQSYMGEKPESKDPNYYLYDSDGGEIEFAVIISNGWNVESQKSAHKIIAEFISEINFYKVQFYDFMIRG